jgi:hypothetical protein
MVYYSVFVIGIVYGTPFLFFSIIKVWDNYEKLKNYVNKKSIISKIKIRSFIFQNHFIYPNQIDPQPIQHLAQL